MPSEEFESELDVGEEEEEVPKPSSLRSVLQLPKIVQNLKSNAYQKLPIEKIADWNLSIRSDFV